MQKWKIEQFRLSQFPYKIEIDLNVSDDYREYITNHHEVYEDILIKRVRNNEFLGVIIVENNKVVLFENWSETISVLE